MDIEVNLPEQLAEEARQFSSQLGLTFMSFSPLP